MRENDNHPFNDFLEDTIPRPKTAQEQLAEAQAAVRELEQAAQREREERQKATKPKRKFTLTQVERNTNRLSFDAWFDPNCVCYSLSCEVLNAEELKAVGHGSWTYSGGSMRYVFNLLSNKLVCSIGGGTIYFGDQETADKISDFIRRNPQGGDISDLIPEKA